MKETERQTKKKAAPAYLFALGHAGMPEVVEVAEGAEEGVPGGRYRFVKLFKHDFFAATGLYEREGVSSFQFPVSRDEGGTDAATRRHGDAANPSGNWKPETGNPPLAVLKIQRVYPLWGVPMRWLGKIVADHEIGIYQKLQGLAGVPGYWGRVGETGFLHEFVPGEPLRPEHRFDGAFFEGLREMLEAIHRRHMAYVDTNKRENILYGADGRPWLIDFQISFWCRKGERDNWLARWLLRRMQRADWYHFYKHKTRLMPQGCTQEEFALAQKRGMLHELHRRVARPIIQLRRRFLSRYELDATK